MKRTTFIILLLVALTGITSETFAQRAIGGRRLVLDDNSGNIITLDNYNRGILIGATGPTGIDPFSSSMLTVDGLGTGGVSPALTSPRGVLFAPMSTAQRNLIVNPANGLLVYNTTTNTYDVFAGGAWGAISGWTMVGNNVAPLGGGTQLGQNFLGTLNTMDLVLATDVGVAGSGLGERMRITATGQVGFSAMNSPFLPLTDFNVDGTNGVANVRLNSLGGAPLMAPALNLAADGITIAGGSGDLLKYDVATVVGSVAWLRTSNNIVDGNNLFGTMAGSATTDVQMVTNGLPVMYLDGTTQFVGVGNSSPAYTLDVNGTLGSTGNSDIGTDPLTNNTFGNNGAGTNQIGAGAQFNYIGDNALNFNSFGYEAVLNDFGGVTNTLNQSNYFGQNDGAIVTLNNFFGAAAGPISLTNNNFGNADGAIANAINNLGSANGPIATTTNNIGAATGPASSTVTNIGDVTGAATSSVNNIGAIGATTNTIGSGTSSTNTVRGTTNINVGINSNTNINTAGTGATAIGTSNSVTINSSANDVTINTDAGNTANDLVLTGIDAPASQFDLLTININGDINAVGRATGTAVTQQGISFDNEGANGTRIRLGATAAGNAAALYPLLVNRFVNLDNFTLSFNRTGVADNMLSLNGATDVVTIEGTTNINVTHNTATNINTGTSTGAVAIGNMANAAGGVTIGANTNDVVVNTTDGAGSDLVLNGIELTNPMTGHVLWTTTPGNEVRKSLSSDLAEQGITWKLEGGALRVRLGALDGDPVPTNALLANRNVYIGAFRLNFSNNAGNSFLSLNGTLNTTQLGFAALTANTVTGTTNTMTASAAGGNTINATGGPNTITGQTGNTITATTGNNTVAASAAQNVITGQTGNSMTATTGNNTIGATAGTNALTAGTSNTMNAPANVMQATGAGGNTINSTAAGNNLVQTTGAGANVFSSNTSTAISSVTSTGMTAGTFTTITSNAGNVDITSNGGDITLDVDGGVNRDIVMNNVDVAVPANTDRALFLNVSNEVNTRTFSALADQGLQYDATAFMLGASVDGTNPITTNRFVRVNAASSLTFNIGAGAANNLLALSNNAVTIGNATNTFSLVSNQLNVAANGDISDVGSAVTVNDALTQLGAANAVTLAGTVTANNSGHAFGATTAARQMTINGVADATGAENNASAVWDLQVIGDVGASGMIKSGNSILIDGVTATRRILSDAAMNISTTAGALTLTGATTVNFGSNIGSHMIPAPTLTYDLGSPANVWNNLYVQNLFLPPMTPGSVLFVGAGGQLSQNNANFFWDNPNGRLGIGTNVPGFNLHNMGTTRLVGTVLTDGTVIAAGNLLQNGLASFFGQMFLANLSADVTPDDFFPVVQTASGGTVETRQISELPFSGGRVKVTTPVGFPYNITYALDYVVICTNAALQTVNLPNAATNNGRVFIIKSTGAGNVSVGSGGGMIDGVAAPYLIIGGGNTSRTFVSNGTDWFIIGN